ncbi:MAG: hypothetical protein B6D64_12080 [Bacteroidetes bacterium 4484_276]|nr:MAG: hypothetical protein B6D64_12080 [Bacteroidetes bacterium 4484_276]
MKKFTTFLILAAFIFNANVILSQTTIPDGTNISGTWDIAGSPYIVEGEAIVQEDATLLIESGVTVKFQTGTDFDYSSPTFDAGFLRINGSLQAVGTENDSILFIRDGDTGNWGTIFANYGSTLDLSYCRVSNANRIIGIDPNWAYRYGAIHAFSNITLSNCLIKDNLNNGIGLHHSDAVISNCNVCSNSGSGMSMFVDSYHNVSILYSKIINNVNGLVISTLGSYVIITDCEILSNSTNGICLSGSASVKLFNSSIKENAEYGIRNLSTSTLHSGSIIENCCFENGKYGLMLRVQGTGIIFKNNYFIENGEKGASIYNRGGNPSFIGNVVYGNFDDGLSLFSITNTAQLISNNTIVNNGGYGIYALATNLSLENNIIWGNLASISNITNNGASYIRNCVLQDNNLPGFGSDLGGNLLNTYPQFSDTTNNDFTLLPTSPCINAGSFNTSILDSTDLAGNPRLSHGRVDMGAYEYQQTGEWLHLVYPNWKEILDGGTSDTIRWIGSEGVSNVKIEYSPENGGSWETITSSTENDGEFIWGNIPDVDVCAAKIRIIDNNNATISDVTDTTFFIASNLIANGEQVSGTWSLANSPYTVEAKAIIPQGQTLTIEPGVEVLFKTGRNYDYNLSYFNMGTLKVEGKLIAEGTA